MSWDFTKLDRGILDSSISDESLATRWVWIAMMCLADSEGRVEGHTAKSLAHRAKVSWEEVQIALRCFLSPDPHSTTPDNDGRRIAIIPRGWQILNWEFYKLKGSLQEKRERATDRKRAQRDRAGQPVTECDQAGQGVTECDMSQARVTECDPFSIPLTLSSPSPVSSPPDLISEDLPVRSGSPEPAESETRMRAAAPEAPPESGSVEGWRGPTAAHEQLCCSLRVNCSQAAEDMRDWARSKGARLVDWDARFNRWIRSEAEKRGGAGQSRASPRTAGMNRADEWMAENLRRIEERTG